MRVDAAGHRHHLRLAFAAQAADGLTQRDIRRISLIDD
ncbi:hypothetical protein BN130_4223 [Cronobacter malonaticus 507]|nr:hypothetical protein BN130_4223 [Cronobacter malonaticus 507]